MEEKEILKNIKILKSIIQEKENRELVEKIKEAVEKTPNDYTLGSLIRSIFLEYESKNKK